MIEEPLTIVARKLSWPKKQAPEFPVSADLLEHKRNGVRAFLRGHIENRDPVSSRWQVRNYKFGAVGGLSGGAKNSTQKLGPSQGSSAFGLQLIRRPWGRVRTRKVRLVFLDRALH